MSRIRTLLPALLVGASASLAACADGPLQPADAAGDPVVAAANRTANGEGRVLSVVAETTGRQIGADGPRYSFDPITPPPLWCDPNDPHPACPVIFTGASVTTWSSGGTKHAALYAHLDAVDNVESSRLSVDYRSVGGCSGSTGTFDSDWLEGGPSGTYGYALIGTRNVEYTGTFKWMVNASSRAFSAFGSRMDGWASDTECL